MTVQATENYSPFNNKEMDYAYKVWKNVNYEHNTMGVDRAEYEEIIGKHQKDINKFSVQYKKEQEVDNVEYDIGDIDDFDISSLETNKTEAKDEPKEVTLEDRKNNLEKANKKSKNIKGLTIASSTLGIVSAAGSWGSTIAGASLAAQAAAHGGISATATTLSTVGKALCFVGCALTLATGVLYRATRPNRDAHEALMELQQLMLERSSDIYDQQAIIDSTQSKISDTATAAKTEFATAEAEEKSKEDNIEDRKAEIALKTELLLTATIIKESISARIQNGEQISDSDKAKLEAAEISIQDLTGEIAGLQEKITQLNSELEVNKQNFIDRKENAKDEMNTLQSEYEQSADNLSELKELTDLAGGFDEVTKKLCTSQMAMQALNVASGVLSMAQASGFGLLGLPFVGMAATGIFFSAKGIAEQNSFRKDILGEIQTREEIQKGIDETSDLFSTGFEQTELDKNSVGDLNLKDNYDYMLPGFEPDTKADVPSPVENTTTTNTAKNGEENIPTTAENPETNTEQEPKKNPFAL